MFSRVGCFLYALVVFSSVFAQDAMMTREINVVK